VEFDAEKRNGLSMLTLTCHTPHKSSFIQFSCKRLDRIQLLMSSTILKLSMKKGQHLMASRRHIPKFRLHTDTTSRHVFQLVQPSWQHIIIIIEKNLAVLYVVVLAM
jgi:hypothetical protein